jgi:hypothetical protein
MVPDITVEEFLDSLKYKFGLLYFLNSNTRSVYFAFMRDIVSLSTRDEINLSKYKASDPAITYRENRQLKLIPNYDIEGTEVKYESYEKFLDVFNRQFHEYYFGDSSDIRYPLCFMAWIRQYATCHWPDKDRNEFNCMSTDFFG